MTDDGDGRRLYEDSVRQPAGPGRATARLARDGSRLVIDHAEVTDASVLGFVFAARLAGDPLEHVVLQCLVRGAQSLAAEAAPARPGCVLPIVDAFATPTARERRRPPP